MNMNKIYQIDEIKEKLQPVFSSAPVYQAILFGSYAKGEASEKSDVDILIDSRGLLVNINFFGLLEDITSALDKTVDMFEISDIREGSPIAISIQEQGVVLFER
ncbi:MAG: nucleotidyltransferase domain-containing protein [Oscillospiraceae bacterium]|nr:nucleotidyltransferase domain-containing protein [Oscillospiraceae bacterium]